MTTRQSNSPTTSASNESPHESDSLIDLEKLQGESNRREFIDTVWTGAPVRDFLKLAKGLDLPLVEADDLIRRIQEARDLLPQAVGFQKVQSAHKRAESDYAKAVSRADQLRSEADSIEDESGNALDRARGLFLQGERAVHDLADRSTRDRGLFPIGQMPRAVCDLIDRRRLDAESFETHRLERQRVERVRVLERSLAELRSNEESVLRVRTPPMAADARERIARLESELETLRSKRG